MSWGNWQKSDFQSIQLPAVLQRADRMDVFRSGMGGDVVQTWAINRAWSPERSIGGAVSSSPVVVTPSRDRMDVFVRWKDGSVRHRWVLENGQLAGDWQSIGGTITSAPAVAFAEANHICVFGRSTDNSLSYKHSKKDRVLFENWNETSWNPLGGILTSAPAAAATQGFILVAVLGTQKEVWCRWARKEGQQYSFATAPNGGWVHLGKPPAVSFTGQPDDEPFATCHLAVGILLEKAFICAIGEDRQIYMRMGEYKNFPGGWANEPQKWEKLPVIGDTAKPEENIHPLGITTSGGYLFVLGSDYQLYQSRWQ